MTGASIALRSPAGRWTLAAAVLGSGAVFLESTVATVALPALGRRFELGFDGLQWVMNAYLLPLSALILLGGSLGDRYPRPRVFAIGLIGFGAASALCALAGSTAWLMAARLAQGTFGALVVPNSLALLDELFVDEDRGAAIGQWAGWSAVSMALGPLLGGWLVDAVSWRWVFAIVVPFAAAAARHRPPPGARRLGRRDAGGRPRGGLPRGRPGHRRTGRRHHGAGVCAARRSHAARHRGGRRRSARPRGLSAAGAARAAPPAAACHVRVAPVQRHQPGDAAGVRRAGRILLPLFPDAAERARLRRASGGGLSAAAQCRHAGALDLDRAAEYPDRRASAHDGRSAHRGSRDSSCWPGSGRTRST